MNKIIIISFFTLVISLNLLLAEDTEVKLTRIPDDVFDKAAIEFAMHFSKSSPEPNNGNIKKLLKIPIWGKNEVLLFYEVIGYMGNDNIPVYKDLLKEVDKIAKENYDNGFDSIYKSCWDYIESILPLNSCCSFWLPVYYEVNPKLSAIASPDGLSYEISDYVTAVIRIMQQFGKDAQWEALGLVRRDYDEIHCWAFSINGAKYVQERSEKIYENKKMMYFVPWDVFMNNYAADIKKAYIRYKGYNDPAKIERAKIKWQNLLEGKGELVVGMGNQIYMQHWDLVPHFWYINDQYHERDYPHWGENGNCDTGSLAMMFGYDTKRYNWYFNYDNWGSEPTINDGDYVWNYDDSRFSQDDESNGTGTKWKHQGFSNQMQIWLLRYMDKYDYDSDNCGIDEITKTSQGFATDHKPTWVSIYDYWKNRICPWGNLIKAIKDDDRPVLIGGALYNPSEGHAVIVIGYIEAMTEEESDWIITYDILATYRYQHVSFEWWTYIDTNLYGVYSSLINFPDKTPSNYLGDYGTQPLFSNINCVTKNNKLNVSWQFPSNNTYDFELIGFNIYQINENINKIKMDKYIRNKSTLLNKDIIIADIQGEYDFTTEINLKSKQNYIYIDAVLKNEEGKSFFYTSPLLKVNKN